MERAEVAGVSDPELDVRGGVVWRVHIAGQSFTVRAFLDEAYGPNAPLFRLPESADPLLAARAVDAAFDQWASDRANVDPFRSHQSGGRARLGLNVEAWEIWRK